MNLMEVQSKLNKLPPLPESVQYLTAAAQGGNPQVPPYMALARISEINKEIQSAQQTQPPAEPLNQSLPKQALQSMGIGALQQGQQQQGMQQMAQQAGAAQQAVPPGIPQPVRQQQPQQQMPQQAPQGAQPVRMAADGGLMGVPVDPRMFEYGSGGIVAFNGEDGDQEVEEDDDEGGAGADVPSGASKYDPIAELRRLQPQIAAQMKQDVRPVRSRADIEKALTKDYGVEEGPVGKGYLEGLASLKEAKAADRAQQQADINERKKFITPRSLLDYSDATRGQTGLGGIGALARSRMNATEKFMGEETDLRQAGIKVDELLNDAQYKVQTLRQAQKDGDIKAEQKADVDLAKIAKDLGVSKNRLLQSAVSGNLSVIGKQVMGDAQIQAAKERAKGKGAGGAQKKTDLDKLFDTKLAARLAAEEPNNAITRDKAMTDAANALSKSSGTVRADTDKIDKANKEFRNRYYDQSSAVLRAKRTKDPTGYATGLKALRDSIEASYGIRPDAQIAEAPTLAPAPAAAPTVGRITPEAFQAKWATLKPNQTLVGPDGVTYTKK